MKMLRMAMQAITLIQAALKKSQLVVGLKEAMFAARAGVVAYLFLSSNLQDLVKTNLSQIAKVQGIELHQLKQNSAELGGLCKKPFAVSVVGVRK